MAKKRWQKPVLHDHSKVDHKHRVTWLELFYDLTFVITISQLTHKLALEVTWSSIVQFIFLFIPVWWAWSGMTFYSDRFETDDLSQRIFTLLSILGVASLSFFIPTAFSTGTTGFVLSYVFIRLILLILWVRAGIYNKPFRPHMIRYAYGFTSSIIIWIASLWFPAPTTYILWIAALLIEYITPLTTMKLKERVASLHLSKHLPERFGLFMIIVLGESIVSSVRGLGQLPVVELNSIIIAGLGLAFAFTIWWLYFDHINERDIKPGNHYLAGWSYGHLPLVMSVAALGAAELHLLAQSGTILDWPTVWLVCGNVAIALISVGILEITLKKSEHAPCGTLYGKLTRFGGAGIALLLPFWEFTHRPAILLTCLIILFVFQIIQGETLPEHEHSHEDYSYIN